MLRFEDLYEQNLDYVWTSLRRLGVAPAHLEDLVHDVFLVAWRKLGEYDPRRPIKPWLFGISFRIASDFRGRLSVRREASSLDDCGLELADAQPGPEARVYEQQLRGLVQRLLATLPLERRAIFVLHELDGLAMPEIADALDVPLNTAYSRLRLARRDFQAALHTTGAQSDGSDVKQQRKPVSYAL